MAQNPELHLWRAVLVAGLRADDAPRWVKTDDFKIVTALAGFESDAVREAQIAGRVAPAYSIRPTRVA